MLKPGSTGRHRNTTVRKISMSLQKRISDSSCFLKPSSISFVPFTLLMTITLLVSGCGGNKNDDQNAAPVDVVAETLRNESFALTSELPGRIQAIRTAEVRARVEGILQRRVFTEGSEVSAGDTLFEIDPAELQAARNIAAAAVEKANADNYQAQLKAKRFTALLKQKLVSPQDYDVAIAAAKQTEADIASAQAELKRTTLNLEYATVTAPISGRIGRALVTEGALVGKNETTHLATIEQLDPVYVNVTQSSLEQLRLRQYRERVLANNGDDTIPVTVTLEDGSTYAHTGKLLFSEMSVDEGTGEVLLRAEVPNPDRILLPGMYVRAQLAQGTIQNAVTVPQRAIIRNAEGAQVMVINPDNTVALRKIGISYVKNDRWLVDSGLRAGERVVIEGILKIKPGARVNVVEDKSQTPANAAAQQNSAK
jgi:membrane fusion protein (multidrug efflux system)